MDAERAPAPCREESVAFGDDAAVLASFQADGYVVVRGVLADEEVDRHVRELWESPQLLARDGAVRRGEAATWSWEHWPQQDGGKNFLESLDPFRDQACWELLQHPRVVHVLQLLYGQEIFAEEAGRWGVMRPAADRPEWRTEESWLHWDQNPWSEPDFARVQCFACLTAQTPTSGGFLCVPGFQERWRAWGAAHPEGTVLDGEKVITREYGENQPFPVPRDDPAWGEAARVLAPKGSLVCWDGRLPHQNFPNTGHDFRVVHYLKFWPARPAAVEARRQALRRKLFVLRAVGRFSDEFFPTRLTPLGRRVLAVPDDDDHGGAAADPRLLEAIALTVQAGEEELRGDLAASVQKFRSAHRVYPEIESWHEAIFGQ